VRGCARASAQESDRRHRCGEDERFYQHGGVDYLGVARAALSNFASGGVRQGASTITMQVARNFFLSKEKTLTRKFNEMLLAFRIESNLSKQQSSNSISTKSTSDSGLTASPPPLRSITASRWGSFPLPNMPCWPGCRRRHRASIQSLIPRARSFVSNTCCGGCGNLA